MGPESITTGQSVSHGCRPARSNHVRLGVWIPGLALRAPRNDERGEFALIAKSCANCFRPNLSPDVQGPQTRSTRASRTEPVMEQRFTFDQVADVYKASRPGYPDALIDDVITYATLGHDDRILEVGCGTGLATAGFAKKGYAILATDPGADMLRGARDDLREFGNVDYLQTTFEALPQSMGGFRLIVAAQSFHWILPEVRFVKAAKVLLPGGTLAVFGHVPVRLPERLRERFRGILTAWKQRSDQYCTVRRRGIVK